MAKEELQDTEQQKAALQHQLQILLLPKDANDNRNIFLEVRAGTGGDEAAIFQVTWPKCISVLQKNRAGKLN